MAANPLEIQNARKLECEIDGLYFARYFMKQRLGFRFIVSAHHYLIQSALDRVMAGEITRLIINIPPGYTKTELAVINFVARGLALYPTSRFLHLSYSDTLALLNSTYVRTVVQSEQFQAMWPMIARDDTDSKKLWWTEAGGGLYATSQRGQVTGFRAGHMEPGFTGALVIDDPIKPRDALSPKVREGTNDEYSDTIKSRIAIESVPIILVGQRVAYGDLSGYLLRGGSGELWHHLDLPVLIDNAPYPEEYTHGIQIEHDLPDGWLWPFKHNEEHKVALKSHKRSFQTQYMQRPKRFNAEGALWTEELIEAANNMKQPWERKRRVVAVDPAGSNDPDSDDTGIVGATEYTDGNFSVDADHTVNDTTDKWADKVIWAHNEYDCDAVVVEVNNGGDLVENVLRLKKFTGRVIAVHASQGKYARAEPISALYEQYRVKHDPDGGLYDLEVELLEYIPSESKKSPNRLDAVVWALTELSNPQKLAGVWG